MNAAIDLIKDKLDEDEASDQKDSEDQSSSSEDDEASEDTFIGMTEEDKKFLKKMEERSKLGLLDTLEDTHVAFRTLLDITNDHGKDEMCVPHTFTVGLAHRFFQRTDPFNAMIKKYEEKQDEMMQTQVERCKKEMDYLQSKLKENLRDDTKAMVKFMKEDNDAKEKELVALRLEHKRLTLQHTLMVSDHEMLKIKFSDTSGNAPNSYEQYQRQIDDWHNKFNARDADDKLLTQQVKNLKNVIVT
jgi:hypothetical protein